MIEKQYRSTVRRHHIEDKAENLPLQRFPVTNPTDTSRNLQQGIQIVGMSSTRRYRRHRLFGVQVHGVLLPQKNSLTLRRRCLRKFHWTFARVDFVFFEQEDKHRVAGGNLVAMAQAMLLDGDTIYLGPISAS